MTRKNEASLTFGPLERRHLPQMAEIERACFSDPWSEQSLADEVDNPLADYYLCEENGLLLGYLGTRKLPDQWEIVNVAVRPQARRRHIASRLMELLLADAAAGDARQIFLEVRESNLPARQLYEAYGFTCLGRRKRYYSDPEEDALIMARITDHVEVDSCH